MIGSVDVKFIPMIITGGTILLWPFLVYGLIVISLVAIILIVSYVLGERHEEHATDEVYEGGIIATGNARFHFPIHFYIIAIFFVVFDVQAVFIMAWAVSAKAVGWAGYFGVATFMLIFISVLIYEWSIGALAFGPETQKILKAYRKKIKDIPHYEVVDQQGK
jgi:NADH-quinone oxidoreductase subunit A